MVYVKSDSWKTPTDDTVVMRYMELYKLKDLIETSEMYFNGLLNYVHSGQDILEGKILDNNKLLINRKHFNLTLNGITIEVHKIRR